jgi:hypothetical protein
MIFAGTFPGKIIIRTMPGRVAGRERVLWLDEVLEVFDR